MNPGLVYLLRRGPIAKFRYGRRRARGVKGALLLIIGSLFLLSVVAIQIFAFLQLPDSPPSEEKIASIRFMGTAALFAMLLLNFSVGGGIYFRPQEIDFLFPAPIPRREILLYHQLRTLGILFLSSTWLFIFLGLRHAPLLLFGFLATFLAFSFLNLASQATGLLFGAATMGVSQKVRRATLLIVTASVLFGAYLGRDQIREGFAFWDFVRAAAESIPFQIIAAPCRPFIELFLAGTPMAGLVWVGVSLAVLALLFQVNVVLDRKFEEAAIRSSQRMQKRIDKVRSAGAYNQAPVRKGPFVLPSLPRLGGAGPILWRQGMEALRSWRSVLIGGLVMGLWLVFVLGNASKSGVTPTGGAQPPYEVFFVVVFASFLMTQNLMFDFRRDLDRMAYLKSLPISPMALAVGQTGVAAFVFTFVQAVLLVLAGLLWYGSVPVQFLWVLAACVPFNWIIVSVQNVGFLIAPHRPAAKGFDPGFMARMIVQMLLRMCAITLLGAGVFGLGWLSYEIFGESVPAAIAGAAVAVVLFLWLLIWVMGKAFAAFDVARDIPG